MEILHNPTFWVAVSFIGFVLLSFKKIKAILLKTLDDRTANIRIELDTARKLRDEAEAILADYRRKQAEYMQEAEQMLVKARADADAYRINAEKDLKTSMEARTQQALDKIAQEESKAIQDVRNHVVDIALAAARSILIEHVSKLPQDELVKLVVSDIERKIH
ncbi:MAG: F0F1 ATP synthase subunit B [Alphaproteobacteria bacterium]